LEQEDNIKQQLEKNSTKAFEELFRLYHNDICNYVFSILLDRQDAEEVAQQTFVKLWEKRDEVSRILSLKSYLYRSAYNLCLNKFKHDKVRERYATEERYKLQEAFLSEFENTHDTEVMEAIKKAVEQLPTKNKEVFTLRYLRGFNTQEVSEELGITVRTVETHVSNALKILREKLKGIDLLTLLLIFFM